jgi:hypothetical protein
MDTVAAHVAIVGSLGLNFTTGPTGVATGMCSEIFFFVWVAKSILSYVHIFRGGVPSQSKTRESPLSG